MNHPEINKDEGTLLLKRDLRICERAVLRLIDTELTDNQYSSLVSFTYNLGAGSLQSSTLRRKLNRGEYESAAREFSRWVFAGGRRLRGLVLRRQAETELFLS
jgi:lysozyme